MKKQNKILLTVVGILIVGAVVFASTSSTLFQGRLVLNNAKRVQTQLIKAHYFEYFLGQNSFPFYTVETVQQSMGGKIEVLDKQNNLVKQVCTLNSGLGGGCQWNGLDSGNNPLPLTVEKYKFKVTVFGPNGASQSVESPLFLFDTTGI